MSQTEFTLEVQRSVAGATKMYLKCLAALSLIALAVGCTPWPPQHEDLAELFERYQTKLLEVEQDFLSTDWIAACNGTAAADLVISRRGQPATAESSATAATIRQMLVEDWGWILHFELGARLANRIPLGTVS